MTTPTQPGPWKPAPAPRTGPFYVRTKGSTHFVLHADNRLLRDIHGPDYEWALPAGGLPPKPGYYWFWGTPFSLGKWWLVEVFRPDWVDPERMDLRWRYLDRSGGDEAHHDVALYPGQWSGPLLPPDNPPKLAP